MRHEALTKQDIERIVATLPAEHRAGHVAILEYQNGLPVDETCRFCGALLTVEGDPPYPAECCWWTVSCPCGRSNSILEINPA